MSLTLSEYRNKMVAKLLGAPGHNEVKRFINAGMRGLNAHQVHGHTIINFIDKALGDLNAFSPMNYDARQWANIKLARVLFRQLKGKMQETPSQ
jgi:hypothetical protein